MPNGPSAPEGSRPTRAAENPRYHRSGDVSRETDTAAGNGAEPEERSVVWRSQLDRCGLDAVTADEVVRQLVPAAEEVDDGDVDGGGVDGGHAAAESGPAKLQEGGEDGEDPKLELSEAIAASFLATTTTEHGSSTFLEMLVLDEACWDSMLVGALCDANPLLNETVLGPRMFVAAAKPATLHVALRLLDLGVEVTKAMANALTGTGVYHEEGDDEERNDEDEDEDHEDEDEEETGAEAEHELEADEGDLEAGAGDDDASASPGDDDGEEKEAQKTEDEAAGGEGQEGGSERGDGGEAADEPIGPPSPWQDLVLDATCKILVEKLIAANADLEDATTDPDMLIAACVPSTAAIALQLIDRGARINDAVVQKLFGRSRLPPPEYDPESALGGDCSVPSAESWTMLHTLIFEPTVSTKALVKKLVESNASVKEALAWPSIMLNSILRAGQVSDPVLNLLLSVGKKSVNDEVAEMLLAPREAADLPAGARHDPDTSLWTSMVFKAMLSPGKALPALLEKVTGLNPKLRRAAQRPDMLIAAMTPSRAGMALRLIKLGARVKPLCSKLLLTTTEVTTGFAVVATKRERARACTGMYEKPPLSSSSSSSEQQQQQQQQQTTGESCCKPYRQTVARDADIMAHVLWFAANAEEDEAGQGVASDERRRRGRWLLTTEAVVGQAAVRSDDEAVVAFMDDATEEGGPFGPWLPPKTIRRVEALTQTVTLIDAFILAEEEGGGGEDASATSAKARGAGMGKGDVTLLLDRMARDNSTLCTGITQSRAAKAKAAKLAAGRGDKDDDGGDGGENDGGKLPPDVPVNYWAEQLLGPPEQEQEGASVDAHAGEVGDAVLVATSGAEDSPALDDSPPVDDVDDPSSPSSPAVPESAEQQPLPLQLGIRGEEEGADGDSGDGGDRQEDAGQDSPTSPASPHSHRTYAFGTKRVLY